MSAVSLGSHAGEGALLKLGGLADEAVAPIASLPIAPALATLFEAFRARAVVTFTHRDRVRTVEPWGLSSKRGHWYVVGFDRDRDAVRAFRADRIDGDVEVGEPDAFEAPADFRPDDHVESRAWLLGDDPPVTVRVRVDADAPRRDARRARHRRDRRRRRRRRGSVVIEVAVTNRAAFRTLRARLPRTRRGARTGRRPRRHRAAGSSGAGHGERGVSPAPLAGPEIQRILALVPVDRRAPRLAQGARSRSGSASPSTSSTTTSRSC